MTKKLQRVFAKLDARWCENWAGVVVDSLTDRVQLAGFRYVGPDVVPGSDQVHPIQQALDEWWAEQDISADSEEVTQAVAVCGEAFIISERDGEDVQTVANAPHLCAVLYRKDAPKQPEFAAKWWDEDDGARLTLYYPDKLRHFVAQKKRKDLTKPDAFSPDPENPEEPNPDGIPVSHFRRDRRQRSRLTNVIPLNNALNKLFADMMVASEFGAFKQRVVIGKADVVEGARGLRTGASEVAILPGNEENEGQDTEVKQLEETELANFLKALDHIASRIAIITHTPKHYLLQQGDVSGEALIAMEAPLVKDAAAYMKRLGTTWQSAASFAMKLSGFDVPPQHIKPVWEKEQTVQPYTEALIIETLAKAGLPLATIMRMVKGWSDDEVAKMLAEMAEDEAKGADLATQALLEAQRRVERGE